MIGFTHNVGKTFAVLLNKKERKQLSRIKGKLMQKIRKNHKFHCVWYEITA